MAYNYISGKSDTFAGIFLGLKNPEAVKTGSPVLKASSILEWGYTPVECQPKIE